MSNGALRRVHTTPQYVLTGEKADLHEIQAFEGHQRSGAYFPDVVIPQEPETENALV